MPNLEDLLVNVSTPDTRHALKAAADAFADALGVGSAPTEDWSAEISVSSTVARAHGDLAEAWTLLIEEINLAYDLTDGRSSDECSALKWRVKDHITALQDILTAMSERRRGAMDARLERLRPQSA